MAGILTDTGYTIITEVIFSLPLRFYFINNRGLIFLTMNALIFFYSLGVIIWVSVNTYP